MRVHEMDEMEGEAETDHLSCSGHFRAADASRNRERH